MYPRKQAADLIAVLVGICIFSFQCSREFDVFSPEEEAQFIGYFHSDECLSGPLGDTAEVEVIIEGLRIDLIHRNAVFNCCLDSILVVFTQEKGLLKLTEMDVIKGDVICDCICPFEVRSAIEVPTPGVYTVEIWYYDGIIWSREIEVGGR